MVDQAGSANSVSRAVLQFSGSAAVLASLLVLPLGARALLLVPGAALGTTLITLIIWPFRAHQPDYAAFVIGLLASPFTALVLFLMVKPDPPPQSPEIFLRLLANATAEICLNGGGLLALLFPLLPVSRKMTTPAPPPRL